MSEYSVECGGHPSRRKHARIAAPDQATAKRIYEAVQPRHLGDFAILRRDGQAIESAIPPLPVRLAAMLALTIRSVEGQRVPASQLKALLQEGHRYLDLLKGSRVASRLHPGVTAAECLDAGLPLFQALLCLRVARARPGLRSDAADLSALIAGVEAEALRHFRAALTAAHQWGDALREEVPADAAL